MKIPKLNSANLRYAMLCICLFAFACGKERTLKTNKDEAGNVVSTYEIDAKTGEKDGVAKEFYQTGELLAESHYVNGKLEGLRKIYLQNGKVDAEEHYVNGDYEGIYRKYFENGKLMQEGSYKGGGMEGEWKTYYSSGKLKEIVVFNRNEENGPFVEYFENGKKKAEGRYAGGDKEEGELKLYNQAGELIRRMDCKEGVCQTVWAADTLNQKNK